MLSGGDDGGRTHGLFVANEALSQLSYIPEILPTVWWTLPESNRSPLTCHASVLPNELRARNT